MDYNKHIFIIISLFTIFSNTIKHPINNNKLAYTKATILIPKGNIEF